MSAPSRVPHLVIGGSAALLALSFPLAESGLLSGPFGWCALVAYVPLLTWVIEQEQTVSVGRVFAVALLVHLLAYGTAFHWVVFHPNPTTVAASVGGVMTLAIVASTPIALAFWTARNVGSAWLLPTWAGLTIGLEHLLSIGPWALPWPVLSMTQAALPHAGLARWIGAPGLTAIVLLSNAVGAACLIWFRHAAGRAHSASEHGDVQPSGAWSSMLRLIEASQWRLRGPGLALGLTFLLAPLLPLPGNPPSQSGADSLTAPRTELLIVQPGMESEAWARTDTTVVNQLIGQTNAALASKTAETLTDSTSNTPLPAIIVWPEMAIFDSLFAITDYGESFRTFLQSMPAPLLTGAMLESSRSTGPTTGSLFRNAALWIDPRAVPRPISAHVDLASQLGSAAIYAKHHLVPFAERVPFSGAVPALRTFAVPSGGGADSRGIAGYVPGPGPNVFPPPSADSLPAPFAADSRRNPTLRIAPLICFETILGPYARTVSQQRGAPGGGRPRAIIALSHVGWWGRSAILPQYRALTALRSLETGLPILVATVRSPSFSTHPDGSITLHTHWMQKTSRLVPIPDAHPAPCSNWTLWLHIGTGLVLILTSRILVPMHRYPGQHESTGSLLIPPACYSTFGR